MILLALLAACTTSPEDSGDTGPSLPAWQTVAANAPGAFFSVWGTAADDVFVVGADPGTGPMALHYTGGVWTPMTGLGSGDLWWVHGGADGLWICGTGGRVEHGAIDGTGFTESVTDPTLTLYGVWGPGDGTAWTVGGDPSAPSDAAAMFHYDGTTWTKVELPEAAAAQFALYKVWGTSAADVWAVGAGGIALHYDGTSWSLVDTLSYVNLFTVNDGYAVGGDISGTILHVGSGTNWVDESPQYAYQITGVVGGKAPVAVGAQGSIWFRGESGWTADPRDKPTYQDLHAVWRDPDDGVWAVGGHISSAPLIQGAIVYSGNASITPVE